ncbi:hypothetical protein WG66_000935 [Moniliophthora roreri]|nr:hypothetical protein WG66_000935 [Moniliophthora roreri]
MQMVSVQGCNPNQLPSVYHWCFDGYIGSSRWYRNVYFHKQTKNQWARDDPAILVLIGACLAVAAIAWSLVYSYSVFEAIELVFLMITRDFLLSGIVVATVLWLLCNRLLVQLTPTSQYTTTTSDSRVEWAYAFDYSEEKKTANKIGCVCGLGTRFGSEGKSFVVIMLMFFWGIDVGVCRFAQYIYGIYLGLNALPFLTHSELLLSPLLPLFTAYVVSLLGFPIARHVLGWYFGS